MSTPSLPVILSRPHGGLWVPSEVQDRLAIDAITIHNECDLWVEQLFDFAPGVLAVVDMPVARVLVDANRPPDDLLDPDGPVKSHTSYGESIYHTPLTTVEQRALRDRYWLPFHSSLEDAVRRHASSCKLILDCHNMAHTGPTAYNDAGEARPLLCLANLGDATGEPLPGGEPVSCAPRLLRVAAQLAEHCFADKSLLEPVTPPPPIVQLNLPFRGGYIVRRIRDLVHNAVPVMMIEINRGLFVGPQHPRSPIAAPHHAHIAGLRSSLQCWLEALLAQC